MSTTADLAHHVRRVLPAPVRRQLRPLLQLTRMARARLRMALGVQPLRRPDDPGYDYLRGLERYYIRQFLTQMAPAIHGHCLEFQEDLYTSQYGGRAVRSLDILHKEPGNPRATIVADLTKLNSIKEHQFDCIMCTHVLHSLADQDRERFIAELQRILAPGGTLLVAVPISPLYAGPREWTRWTPAGLEAALAQVFGAAHVTMYPYGNSLTTAAHARGVYADELSQKALAYQDRNFAFELCARAMKSAVSVPGRG